MAQSKRHKNPRTLNEPFRSFREVELAIERARASYCFFQHKVLGRSLRDVANEVGMSYERIRHLAERAETVYGLTEKDYVLKTRTQIDIDEVEVLNIMVFEVLTVQEHI